LEGPFPHHKWKQLHKEDKNDAGVHVYSDDSSSDDEGMDEDDGTGSSETSSSDDSIEIEAPMLLENEQFDDYLKRTKEFWYLEARKELKNEPQVDPPSVRVEHLAKQMAKLFYRT